MPSSWEDYLQHFNYSYNDISTFMFITYKCISMQWWYNLLWSFHKSYSPTMQSCITPLWIWWRVILFKFLHNDKFPLHISQHTIRSKPSPIDTMREKPTIRFKQELGRLTSHPRPHGGHPLSWGKQGRNRIPHTILKYIQIHINTLQFPPNACTLIHHWNHETRGEGGLSKEENSIST